MAAAKQQEEKRVQFLRRMVALPHNRHCFDCGQRGPTYVNMTVGSYVCTACSGILRGINPPHRVKSVSMASFNQEEVDLLTQRGNEYNKQVWLGLHATKEPPQMDTKDEIKLRDYLTQKYERKRWYQAPTDALAEEAKTMNSQTPQHHTGSSSAIRRPVAGGFRLQAGSFTAQTASSVPKTIPAPSSTQPISAPAAMTAPVAVPAAHQPLAARTSTSTSADLLSDVFGSKPAADSTASATTEFSQPNFANFSGAQVTQPTALISTADSILPEPSSTAILADITDSGASGMPPSSSANHWSTLSTASGADNKYASLTGLFSDSEVPAAAPVAPGPVAAPAAGVNWNAINWGGASAAATTAPPTSVLGSSPAGGMNWGTPPSSQPTQTNQMFPPAQQPAGAANAGWSAPAPATGVNPFLGASSSGFTPAQPPQHQPFAHAQAPAGYTVQQPQMFAPAANPQMSAGFGAFGQQPMNGQMTAATAAMSNGAGAQWAGSQWGASNTAPPANQWGAVPSKQPTSVNPFLGHAQAPPVQQTAAATNPFL